MKGIAKSAQPTLRRRAPLVILAAAVVLSTWAASASGTTLRSSGFVNYMKTLPPPNFVKPTKKLHIAFLDASTVLPQQNSIKIGAEDAAKKYGISLKVYDAGGFQNVTKQVNQFETALASHPDAIMILPASPVAFNAQIKQAESEGIKVIPLLIPPPTAKFDFALADDLPFDAAKSVDALAQRLHGKGNIYALIGLSGSTVADLFTQGMTKELKKYPGLKVVFRRDFPGSSVSLAQSATEAGLVSQPNVDGVITNDTIFGYGAARALATQGKSNVVIAGIGPGNTQTIDGLKSGQLAVGSGPPFYAVGYASVMWAAAIVGGRKPPKNVVRVPPLVLTKDNIAAAIKSGTLFQVLAPSAIGCGPGQKKSC